MQTNIIERARRYIANMPPSIQGSGGSLALFNVALALAKGFNLPETESAPLLAEWNQTNAVPPWPEAALLHKLRYAKKASKPDGYLLKADEHQSSIRTPSPSRSDAVTVASMDQMGTDAEKARKRDRWPVFKRPTDAEILALAKLRKLQVEAVDIARAAGWLWSATVDRAACFVIREGDHFAQAMRYDGMPFALPGEPKKKTLPGSLSKGFVGWSTLGDPACPVLLVEGVAGLLEGIAALRAVDADARPGAGWTVLAAISCHSRFADEAAPVPDLTGRRFRILPDNDEAGTGYTAAAVWQMELEAMGTTADAYPLPDGCKDIGPVVAAIESHRDYLNQLFTI
jgi:hypothetical protein